MPLIPAFTNSSATGPELLRGVNYASSASGILDDTGSDLVSLIFDISTTFKLQNIKAIFCLVESSKNFF